MNKEDYKWHTSRIKESYKQLTQSLWLLYTQGLITQSTLGYLEVSMKNLNTSANKFSKELEPYIEVEVELKEEEEEEIEDKWERFEDINKKGTRLILDTIVYSYPELNFLMMFFGMITDRWHIRGDNGEGTVEYNKKIKSFRMNGYIWGEEKWGRMEAAYNGKGRKVS